MFSSEAERQFAFISHIQHQHLWVTIFFSNRIRTISWQLMHHIHPFIYNGENVETKINFLVSHWIFFFYFFIFKNSYQIVSCSAKSVILRAYPISYSVSTSIVLFVMIWPGCLSRSNDYITYIFVTIILILLP